MAKEGTNAGKFYNSDAINYLLALLTVGKQEKIDLDKELLKSLRKKLPNYTETIIPNLEQSLVIEANTDGKKVIKLLDTPNLSLKTLSHGERGELKLIKETKHFVYLEKHGSEAFFCMRIECSGGGRIPEYKITHFDDYFVIYVKGEKFDFDEKDKKNELAELGEQNKEVEIRKYFDNREHGPYTIETAHIPSTEYRIFDERDCEFDFENGYIMMRWRAVEVNSINQPKLKMKRK